MNFEEVVEVNIVNTKNNFPCEPGYLEVLVTNYPIEHVALHGKGEITCTKAPIKVLSATSFQNGGLSGKYLRQEEKNWKLVTKPLSDFNYTKNDNEDLNEIVVTYKVPMKPLPRQAENLTDAALFCHCKWSYRIEAIKTFSRFLRQILAIDKTV